MDFHPFLYLNKILGILDFKMPNNDNINYNNIIISSKNNSYNFSNLPIIYNDIDLINNPRLEIFYSE